MAAFSNCDAKSPFKGTRERSPVYAQTQFGASKQNGFASAEGKEKDEAQFEREQDVGGGQAQSPEKETGGGQ